MPPVPDFREILGVDAAEVAAPGDRPGTAREAADAAQGTQDAELAAALTEFSDSMVARDHHLREYAAGLELRVKALEEELAAAQKRGGQDK
jgi:hypothetical protein